MWNTFKNTSLVILLIAVITLIVLLFQKEDPKTITKYITLEIPMPGKQATFPPVILPTPKTEKSRPTLMEEFNNSTEKQKDSLYEESIKERFYEEKFTDSTQSITVSSKVQGKLLKQTVSYEIFPYTIKVDTAIQIKVPDRLKLYIGGEISYPMQNIQNDQFQQPVLAAKLYGAKGRWLISAGVDTQTNLLLGAAYKLKF